jgi:hypothetical protein
MILRRWGVWLFDDVVAEDFPRGSSAGWEFPAEDSSSWGCLTQSHLRAETRVGRHVKCPVFLSDLNKIWNVWTNLSSTSQFQI